MDIMKVTINGMKVEGITPMNYSTTVEGVIRVPNIYHHLKYDVMCQVSGNDEVRILFDEV